MKRFKIAVFLKSVAREVCPPSLPKGSSTSRCSRFSADLWAKPYVIRSSTVNPGVPATLSASYLVEESFRHLIFLWNPLRPLQFPARALLA
jgi:hypothetical protein